jgi:hypothetical protein
MNTQFRTILEVPEGSCELSYQNPSMWIGSCFTENIGGWMREMKFPAMVNPFGTIFNPAPLTKTLSFFCRVSSLVNHRSGF